MPDLGSTLSLNSSNFGAGIAEARAKLTELNTALIENRNKMKEVNKEASELQKQEKALAESMKDGGTKEQQEEMIAYINRHKAYITDHQILQHLPKILYKD